MAILVKRCDIHGKVEHTQNGNNYNLDKLKCTKCMEEIPALKKFIEGVK